VNSFTAALLVAMVIACVSRAALGFRRPARRRAGPPEDQAASTQPQTSRRRRARASRARGCRGDS
jgi:hypothetical protein